MKKFFLGILTFIKTNITKITIIALSLISVGAIATATWALWFREAPILNPDYEPDYWYVLKTTTQTGKVVSRVATNQETFEFINGYIKLSKTAITNEHANHKFHVQYTVDAMQIVNVPDPLANPGYGPWWNYVLGDIEDIN